MVMPVCRWPDGQVTSDSFAILAEIDRRYPKSDGSIILSTDRDKVRVDQSRLERLFVLYVLKRFTWGNKCRFVHAWAKTMPSHPNNFVVLLSHICRVTMTLYFMMLIQGGIWSQKKKKSPIYKEEHFVRALKKWSERLGDKEYFGGTQPCYLDFALLGQIQCISSGLTDFIFPAFHEHPSLMRWIKRMHKLIPSYPYLHSRRMIADHSHASQPSKKGIAIFYVSLTMQVLFAPVTFGLLLHAFMTRRRNPARTMGVMQSVQAKETSHRNLE